MIRKLMDSGVSVAILGCAVAAIASMKDRYDLHQADNDAKIYRDETRRMVQECQMEIERLNLIVESLQRAKGSP